mmetsp:Transcript_100011/g.320814  ORF Transcript_100011/g.320814 Transcript_100011/m.320814 type:complete len:278 (-) Transcript_100011:157-990(-)
MKCLKWSPSTCTVAACLCGHDAGRRAALMESLGMWARSVLLPFFTLAGACLQLPGLAKVFPAAVTLVILRMLANFLGTSIGGRMSRRFFPQQRITDRMVNLLWTCLLAQAGVTMGLVIAVQSIRSFHKWSGEFAILILGVVMLNQMLGPVFCRVGIKAILEDEAKDDLREDTNWTENENSDAEASTTASSRSHGLLTPCTNDHNAQRTLSVSGGLYDKLVSRRSAPLGSLGNCVRSHAVLTKSEARRRQWHIERVVHQWMVILPNKSFLAAMASLLI